MTQVNARTLGRSGLVVSPFALGTMTFGTPRWGCSDSVSNSIFNAYVDAGGTFIDTADVYAGGASEEMVGRFIAARNLRDAVVLATKFAFRTGVAGNLNGGGNGRKHVLQALDASLRRLRTDYVDLYWLHIWDTITPVEEVLQTLGDLVRAGKIRYFGLSNVPAWYAVRLATLAQSGPVPIALQLEYSLVQRGIEDDHMPAARMCGLGICPWSPLAGGFLSGKYVRGGGRRQDADRLNGANPLGDTKFTDHNWRVLDVVRSIADEIKVSPAQVALAWTLRQNGVASIILGARDVEQLQTNLAAADVELSVEHLQKLDEVSSPSLDGRFRFGPEIRRMLFGATPEPWR